MKVQLSLFGEFRSYQADAQLALELPDGASVGDLRAALARHGAAHWPGFRAGLLQGSAFASQTRVLRDGEPLPADGRMAVLPPVSGG